MWGSPDGAIPDREICFGPVPVWVGESRSHLPPTVNKNSVRAVRLTFSLPCASVGPAFLLSFIDFRIRVATLIVMSTQFSSLKRAQTDLPEQSVSPMRQGSTASTNSSIYSASSSFVPSRTSTVSSNSSIPCNLGHHRGKSEASTMVGSMTAAVKKTERESWTNAGTAYNNIRRSLRPLQQAPNIPPSAKPSAFRHSRSQTIDESQNRKDYRPSTPESRHAHFQENESPRHKAVGFEPQTPPPASPHHWSPNPASSRPSSPQKTLSNSPHPPQLTTALSAPELETFQKSSTRHLRTLSKIAQSGENEEFQFGTTTPTVVGLQGRRRLKRADSVAGRNGAVSPQKPSTSSWAAGNWMDQQRQFLQAYEYLCHIGEAKEWIEEVIQTQIPPIVQLEEALRDGVTLAEVVQAMYPDRTLRIFRNPKLQYRHSDNIAVFFRFLDEIELPELFRFELIDLYEKKNLPKVIHCIHALSWLLFKNGLLDFRMGNLVGQLEFEHHELEKTQKGLDKSGVSMPSFAGMAANFGAEPEPEPEPVETEEERIDRELHEHEASISDFQAQIRGAMLRLKLGSTMNDLWDFEPFLIDLQARLRGDWARQISQYRLSMRQFAVNLQAISRGFIVRHRQQGEKQSRKAQEYDILKLQSLIRGSRARAQGSRLQTRVRCEESGIKQFQAAIRGALQRKNISDQHEETRCAEQDIAALQAVLRGALQRKQMSAQSLEVEQSSAPVKSLQAVIRGTLRRQQLAQMKASLHSEATKITSIQSNARALVARKRHSQFLAALAETQSECTALQAIVRGATIRKDNTALRTELAQHQTSVIDLQGILRGQAQRQFLDSQRRSLAKEEASILELQSRARAVIQRNQRAAERKSLEKEEPAIIELQALARAAVSRIQVGGILTDLEDNEEEIAQLQALARAMIARVEVGQMLSDLEAEEDIVTDLQSRIRGQIIRNRFEERRRHYNENMEKVIKAQSVIRGRIQGQAYKSLTSGKNPPVGTVKGFVHLLNDSDFDFDEEIEFERLRKVVVQQVRQNELAEQYISQLDIKIALLVKNKITLDEVVKHQKHFGGHIGNLLSNTEISSKDPYDLKALNKTSRKKLDQYQVFFFLLQTQSQYLARLFRRLRELNTSDKEYERIRHLMMGLFGYSQKRREEYYLIKLLARSAKEDIDSFASLPEYLRCTSFWNKLFGSYAKSPRDRKFLRDVLGTVVRESIIDNPELDLESDPIQIYRSAINNEELRTGQRSRRQPDLPREEAIRDPETRETFIQHLQDLRDIADQFFLGFENFLYRMPFGIRYLAQQMYQYLLEQFSSEDPGYILQTVGHWVWKNYFQPAVLEPEKYGVVDRGLTQEQKRNLGEISKVVAQVASGRLFGTENVYLQPLNSYIGESIQRLGRIWGQMISIQDAESYFDIDEFNDLYAKAKPTLYIKMSDIFSIHQLVASEISYMCPHPDDFLKELVRELGNVKSNENELMSVNSAEVNLTLNPKLAQVEDPEADVKALFMETKRCILYIIRVQSGANLMDIMVKPPTEEDEERWQTLVTKELTTNNARRGAYSEASTLIDIGSMDYAELKHTALENIVRLEQTGKITRHNHYQDLLNAIAIDIRTKHRRRIQRERELEGSRLTSGRLSDQAIYLDQQLKTYNDYIEQAMITLQNKKGKKRFLMPFTKQWDHQRELQKSGKVFKFGSYKYSARTLADRGVLVSWKGYTERQWERVDLTISSNEVGVFTIDGSSGNMMIPGANAQVPLDDLLQAQFNNLQFMDFFDGHMRVNVNLFLHLIMKKFYNE
ncbi:Rho GTPase activation protein [Penicillium alfredii]|uniref:Rho GTPase activation protein n=1 Tax=Penicillium alfredii TaxID=1506179 RepID=A0A9W9K868_9EURO|nr:Rho GTPase activation protein [Penicillium alfredii]KAJ5095687.1 Rho GTPase activation protein [Penicillium alfredii]